MPDALISSTTSRGPGVGSGKSRSSSRLSPRNTTPFIESLLLPTRPSTTWRRAMARAWPGPSLARKPRDAHHLVGSCQTCVCRLRSWATSPVHFGKGWMGIDLAALSRALAMPSMQLASVAWAGKAALVFPCWPPAYASAIAMEVPYVFGSVSRACLILGFALSAAILQAPMSTAGNTQENVHLRLGTATPGGGFPVYGAAFIAAIQGSDPGLAIAAINTKGSTENVPLLAAGSLDIALVQGEVVHETLTGVGRPAADLKIITAMYSTPGMFVVRADSPEQTIADLKGKPVAFGAA